MNINWTVLFGILGYNLIIILGVGIWLKVRERTHGIEEDFANASHSMHWTTIAASVALTCIGGGHIMGLTAQATATGVATLWYNVAHGIMMILILIYVCPWYRRMGLSTINQMFEAIFSPTVIPILTGVSIATGWAIVTLETQGLGAIVSSVTGLEIWKGAIIGGCIGILYVILCGVAQVGWVNLINATLMYVVLIATVGVLAVALPNGWSGVNEYFISSGQSNLLTLFGSTEIVKTYVIGTIISCLFYNPVVQQCAQSAGTAKKVSDLKKACYLCIPLNVLFGIFVIAMGMAANSLGLGVGGPAVFAMCIQYLPTPLACCVIGVFLAAILSTFGMISLATGTMVAKDIHEKYFAPKPWTLKENNRWIRIYLIIFAVGAIAVSAYMPAVTDAITWVFSWMAPIFFMFVVGMHYKRSVKACIATWVICWIANMVLSLTNLMDVLGINGNNYAIVMMILSVVFGFGLTALDKNAKPSFVKVYKQERAAYDARRAAAAKPTT